MGASQQVQSYLFGILWTRKEGFGKAGGKILWRQDEEGTHGKARGKILWRQEGTHGKAGGKILWRQEGTHGKAGGEILWRQDEEGTHGKARGIFTMYLGLWTFTLLWGGSREDGVITSGCRCQFVIRSTTGPTMNQFCTSQ